MKDIRGYEGLYAITSCGKVWSYKRHKFLKPNDNGKGYMSVYLFKDGKREKYYIHRLVAEAYIPNPDNLETVDHIDGNKEHNYINNLQWMTHEDNVRKGTSKPVKCIETDQIFESAIIAAKELNLHSCNISLVCNGKYNHTGGYHFKFVEEV